MRWKWEYNVHSECKTQMSVTVGNKLPHRLGPPQLVSTGLVNVILTFVTILIVPGKAMWFSAYIFRHSTNIDSHGYLLPQRFYTSCKTSNTLEKRKDRRGDGQEERVWCDWYGRRCDSYAWTILYWFEGGWSDLFGHCQLSFLHCFHMLFSKWK